jgi:hypothetical protein
MFSRIYSKVEQRNFTEILKIMFENNPNKIHEELGKKLLMNYLNFN